LTITEAATFYIALIVERLTGAFLFYITFTEEKLRLFRGRTLSLRDFLKGGLNHFAEIVTPSSMT
jgi:hypothetical protein